MKGVYISLGSNLGNREEYLRHAREEITRLKDTSILALSSIIETEPVDFIHQPSFLNQVIEIETGLTPDSLLHELLTIEDRMGRKRVTHKGPRIIDLDILLYNSYIIKTKSVTIPHEELNKRFFFIELLMELDPEIKDPRSKKSFKEIVNHGNTLNQ